jgi:cytidylate kinase
VDVPDETRTPKSSIYASDVSAIPEVRAFLMDMQRSMAEKYSVVMDGRDIGTVVLPNADVKVFLTASAAERARRRWLELQKRGSDASFDEVLRDIEYRDRQDSSRAAAPLKAAEDAVRIDTSGLSFDESVEAVAVLIRTVLNR